MEDLGSWLCSLVIGKQSESTIFLMDFFQVVGVFPVEESHFWGIWFMRSKLHRETYGRSKPLDKIAGVLPRPQPAPQLDTLITSHIRCFRFHPQSKKGCGTLGSITEAMDVWYWCPIR